MGDVTKTLLLLKVLLMVMSCHCLVLETPTILNHLVKIASDTRLLVGAVNHLYMVDSDLNVIQNVSTGPAIDSKDCSPSSCTTGTMTDNYNKLLAVYNDQLVTCGNVRQGACEIRTLQNISDYTAYRSTWTMVAANTPEASTIGVVIPGKDAICVGVTFTDGGPRDTNRVPVVSTRPLTGSAALTFRYATLKLKSHTSIPTSYRFGFHHGKFTYFLFHQSGPFPAISKIARICDDDVTYYSYIEIPLKCTIRSTVYDVVHAGTITKLGTDVASNVGVSPEEDVLVAVFHKSGVADKSAICVYRFQNVTSKINENGNECFQKGGYTNAEHYGQGSHRCAGTTRDYSTISCGELAGNIGYFTNTPVVGTIPVSPAMTLEVGSQLSSVLVKTIEGHTIVYGGTTDGVLKKIHVKSSTDSRTFKNLTLSDGRVMEDMLFDSEKKHIYVMSGKKLHKLASYECNVFTSCAECVAARDPHCGWCTLENKCSLPSECQAVGVSKKWYSYDADPSQCIAFLTIEPIDRMSVVPLPINLSLTIPHLPQDNTYTCVFGGSTSTPATMTPSGVRCKTTRWLWIPEHDDHVTVPLSLNSSETGVMFISKKFTFFSCEAHNTCTSCTRSQWGCLWCVFDHKCVHPTDNAICKPGNITSSIKCPRIDLSTPKILLPNGFRKEFVLKTRELPAPMAGQTGYQKRKSTD